MNDYREKVNQIRVQFPKNWIQILKAKVNKDLWEHILQNTLFLPDTTPNRDRALFFIDGYTEIKKCACGNPIYLYKNKTCGNGDCTIKFRDKEKHQKAIQAAAKLPTWSNKAQASELVKKGYDKINKELNAITELYDLETTITKVRSLQDQLFGKSGNRTCLKIDKVLYKSIKEHSGCLSSYYPNARIAFTRELAFLLQCNGKEENLLCEVCKEPIRFDPMQNKFLTYEGKNLCKKCRIKTNSIEWFKQQYGDDWEVKKNEHYAKISAKGNLGISGFIQRYGEIEGPIQYSRYWTEVFKKRKSRLYSQISQKLFWLIYNELNPEEQELTKFGELNGEQVLFPGEMMKNNCIFLDFICKKKVIEYNGSYWHQNKERDDARVAVMQANGLDVLIITDKDFNRKFLNKEIVKQCIDFIRGANAS